MSSILRDISGAGTLCFPVGRPPEGTCAFASMACLEACCALGNKTYRRSSTIHVSVGDKLKNYKFFQKNTADIIASVFIGDLRRLNRNILYWFGSGDCLPQDQAKVLDIIAMMPKEISQVGFTRNRKLWAIHPEIFALTVEPTDCIPSSGLIARPDYETGDVCLSFADRRVKSFHCHVEGLCGCHKNIETSYYNCEICRNESSGCFTRRTEC